MNGFPGTRKTWLVIAALAALAICAVPPSAHADWVVLKNGQRLHITGYDRCGAQVILQFVGGQATVPAAQVSRFEPEDDFPAAKPAPAAATGPFAREIADAARRNGLDRNLLRSVIHAESNFQPRAVSSQGALGLMQLMPSTAHSLTVRNPFNPSENVQAGARYLKGLLDQFGNLNLALAAYNAGPGRVRLYRGVPPFAETHAYIARVRKGMKPGSLLPASSDAVGMVKVVCGPGASACRQEPVDASDSAPFPR